MLNRGREIVILKSSVKGKGHPAKKDRGYINDVFIFPKYGFILVSAFFFHYDCAKNNCNRCEKKKFILDICMDTSTKKKILEGVSTEYLLNDDLIFNINTLDYNVLIKNIPIYSNRLIKLPIVELCVKDKPRNLSLCNLGEIKAWFKTQLPLLEYRYNINQIPNVNTISKTIMRIYTKMNPIMMIKSSLNKEGYDLVLKENITKKDILEYIYYIRQVQAVSQNYVVNNILNKIHRKMNLQKELNVKGIHYMMKMSPHSTKIRILISTLLKPDNIQREYATLNKLKIKTGVPSVLNIDRTMKSMAITKKDFRTNSEAALHRLVTENKYINSLFTRR